MNNYLERKISEIDDDDFQTLVAELCECVDWFEDEFENKTLANLFTALVTENKKLNLNKVLFSRVLAMKVKELAFNSVVEGVCCELASRKGKAMDDLAGKLVFTLIKQCYKAVCPQKLRPKRPTQLQKKHQLKTALILRRRSNDAYF